MTRSKSKAYWIQCLLSFVPANAKAIWLKELLTKVFAPPKEFTITDLKQRTLAFNHLHHLPSPEQFQLTPASENDINLFKQAWGNIENRTFLDDINYHDTVHFNDAEIATNSLMLTYTC